MLPDYLPVFGVARCVIVPGSPRLTFPPVRRRLSFLPPSAFYASPSSDLYLPPAPVVHPRTPNGLLFFCIRKTCNFGRPLGPSLVRSDVYHRSHKTAALHQLPPLLKKASVKISTSRITCHLHTPHGSNRQRRPSALGTPERTPLTRFLVNDAIELGLHAPKPTPAALVAR